MRAQQVIEAMEAIAPVRYAAAWDNVGLLVGSTRWTADRVLLTIDLTHEVLEEAIAAKAQMIVAYHPPIFEAIKSLTDRTEKERVVLDAARARIAVYSPHTALDAAPEGVNDWMASGLGTGDVRALEAHAGMPASEAYKVVTFCPAEAVDGIRKALATVGAGNIGAYALCSFELPGTGTFVASEEARPVVGGRGTLERVEEVRLEMVCPQAALGLAVLALREFHPYEEPPIELYKLHDRPDRHIGQGRRVVLDAKVPLQEIVDPLKRALGVRQLRVATGRGAPRRHQMIGLCAGAGGSLLEAAIEQGCTIFVTGEMRHHDVLAAQARGCTVILAGHTNTERGYLKVLRRRLGKALDGVTITVSKRDADPLRVM
jgi:dinuclear metal center YbgI/SA1388 family protein